MPKYKTRKPKDPRPHISGMGGSKSKSKMAPGKNSAGSNSTQRSSDSDDLVTAAKAVASKGRTSRSTRPPSSKTPKSKPVRNESTRGHTSRRSEQWESVNKDVDSRRPPRPEIKTSKNPPSRSSRSRNISSAPKGRNPSWVNGNGNANDIQLTKVYSKTLENLGRPLSRVATAFIADITAIPYASTKKKSLVHFTDEFDVLDVDAGSETPRVLGDDDNDWVKRGHRGHADRKKTGWHVKVNESSSEETSSEGERSSDKKSTSDSDAAPPLDPTAHVEVKKVKKAPIPHHPRVPTSGGHKILHRAARNFVSQNKLSVVNLPLSTTIDDLKRIFSRAMAIKMMLTCDRNERYRRNATIEFANETHAKISYNQTKHTRIGNSVIEFLPNKTTLREDSADDNGNGVEEKEDEESSSEESVDDLLPTVKVDKDSMVREWIKIQSGYATKSNKTFMDKLQTVPVRK